ncbi:MAG: F0F1 ATP synthase subunit B [Clostridia bacterium]|nr:F0F1 ATP synthase subunit B [Clostridia bacterium]
MQSLDIISVNIWQILISLFNLVLIYLIVKKVFYNPVKKMLAKRQEEVDDQYAAAKEAEQKALADKTAWEEKLQNAENEADALLKAAVANADRRGDTIVAEARDKAADIIRRAENEAELERRKAEAGIKQEIVDVSALLATQMLGREVRAEDHRELIDSFIEEIGDGQ